MAEIRQLGAAGSDGPFGDGLSRYLDITSILSTAAYQFIRIVINAHNLIVLASRVFRMSTLAG